MRLLNTAVAALLMVGLLTSCQPDPLSDEQLVEVGLSNEDLRVFLDEFIDIGLENGFDYTYVYKQPIKMQFTNEFKFGHNGQSWGINDDRIEIYINADWFIRQKARADKNDGEYSTYTKYVIFHELAHDILNLKHKHGTRLMDTKAERDEEALIQIVVDAMKYARDKGRNSGKEENEKIECQIE